MRARTFSPSSACLNSSLGFSGVRSPSAQAPVALPACRWGRVGVWVTVLFCQNGYGLHNRPLFDPNPPCPSGRSWRDQGPRLGERDEVQVVLAPQVLDAVGQQEDAFG